MKKIIFNILTFAFVITMFSCEENSAPIFDGEFIQMREAAEFSYPRINDGEGTPSGFEVVLAGAQRSSATNFTFSVDPSSTAIENLHYRVESNTGSIPANSSVGAIPITILDDNINAGERLTVVVNLDGADVPTNVNYTQSVNTIQVSCEADLSTDYSYTNEYAGGGATGTATGTGVMSIADGVSGQYRFDDFSFGSWDALYGIDPPTGTLLFKENCGFVSLSGTDNYGDTWQMDAVVESGGPNFTFTYSNTYGESGRVTLVRADGSNWPAFSM